MTTTKSNVNAQIDADLARLHPELSEALISAILPLEKYLLTESARNTAACLRWKFTIGEQKQQLTKLTELMNGIL